MNNGLVELEKIQKSEFLLDDYLTKGSAIKKSYGGKEYEIEKYQGEHANEYCVYEVKNGVRDGTAELYNDGMISMRWTMKEGARDGRFLIYDRGVVVREGRWSDIGNDEERVINNSKADLTMTIRVNGQIVYEGDYNESMEREGLGYKYENGLLKGFGEWKKDEFIEVKQRFISDEEMIEYGSGSTQDVLSHKPIYIGGYIFDEESGRMKRHGAGRLLNEWTGVCERESEWEKGKELSNKGVALYDGWYHEQIPVEFARRAVTGYEPFVWGGEVVFEEPSQVEEITGVRPIDFTKVSELRLYSFSRLKQMNMVNGWCARLSILEIDGLSELESLSISGSRYRGRIGERSWSFDDNNCMRIVNCCKLKSIRIEQFYNCGSLEIKNLSSLRSIEIGENCFCFAPSFSLTSMIYSLA